MLGVRKPRIFVNVSFASPTGRIMCLRRYRSICERTISGIYEILKSGVKNEKGSEIICEAEIVKRELQRMTYIISIVLLVALKNNLGILKVY